MIALPNIHRRLLALLGTVLLLTIGPLSTSVLAQETFTIEGVVTDSTSGETLPGVNVLVEGTSVGVTTGGNGQYTIEAPSAEGTLQFSFIGYRTKAVAIEGRSEVNVLLARSVTEMEEVVVSVAYGQQEQGSITSSISRVDTEGLLKAPTSNVANALVGKVTGIQSIQRSGQPGADAADIYIRGVGSINRERARPLIIVDGVERASFADLDVQNIESISILKDAAATAPYGVRGANGVILVTTKRGRVGPAQISVNMSAGTQVPTTLLDLTGSYEYAQAFNEAQRIDNPNIDQNQLRFSEEAMEAFRTGSSPMLYPNTDWVDRILKPSAFQTNNNISVSGGTESLQYYVSGGFLRQDGLFRVFSDAYDYNYSFDRFNFRANLDASVTPTTTVKLTSGGRVEESRSPQNRNQENLWRQIYWSVPFSGPGIVDGRWIRANNEYINGEKKDGLEAFYGTGYSQLSENTLNLDLSIQQEMDFLTEGLTFSAKGAYNNYYSQTKWRGSTVAYYSPFYRTDVDPSAQGDSTIAYRMFGTDGTLDYSETYGKDRDWYAEAKLSYDQTFANKHDVGLMALYNQQRDYYLSTFASIPRSYVGMVGRVSYGYDSRYLVDFNMGYNGSENFAVGNRFGFFPAVSAGWVVSNESFMEDVGFLDYLKLRGSYGLVGNDRGVGRFLYLPDRYYNSCTGYNFGNQVPQDRPGACEGEIGNPQVQWETAAKQNYGFDLTLFDSKLEVNFDYFRENRNNILTTRNTIPGFVSANLPAVNIGRVKNQGFEVELDWRQQLGRFSYHINPNVSFARNEVLFIDEIPPNEPYMSREGESVGQRFGWVFDRFYTEEDAAAAENGTLDLPDHQVPLQPGDLIYEDLNEDGIIDNDDVRPIGYPEYPEVTAGMNVGFSWGNFDVTTVWAGATNTSRILSGTPYRDLFGYANNRALMQWQYDGRWTPGSGQEATYPRLSLQGESNNNRTSTFWLRDASYVRLKNAEIGYTLEPTFLKGLVGLQSMRVYVNGYNLLTFSDLDIADPEARTTENSDYPITKVYNAGIRATF